MRATETEAWLKELFETSGDDQISSVETYSQDGLHGAKVRRVDGAMDFYQIVRIDLPGNPQRELWTIPSDRS